MASTMTSHPAARHTSRADSAAAHPVASSDVASTPPELLVFKEAMSYLRVSRSTIYRMMWSKQLTGHKVGATWRFYRDDLNACIQSGSTEIPEVR